MLYNCVSMTTIKDALIQLENRLQNLVEGSAARLFPGSNAPTEMVRGLLRAMQDGVHYDAEGEAVAPNLYILSVPAVEAERLRSNPQFLDEAAGLLLQACRDAGLRLSGPLSIKFETNPLPGTETVQVIARDSARDVTPTAAMFVPISASETFPRNAYLIVDGVRVFPLEQGVINIGRRPDNHLVIDDTRVSRLHAQLRLARGRYVVFDLESTGGTFVNGRRITQHTLSPGDVISLAGLPLVYGQDETVSSDTQKLTVEEP